MAINLVESNESGEEVATYVASRSDGTIRIDVIRPNKDGNVWKHVLAVFLPAGYPHSVTEDYMRYQIYDSLQAFASSIAGLLSSRAVLQGVGVGDATASATAALLLSVLQDSMGRIATILFAHKLGTTLEPECKMYRLAADIFNDSAMILDCLSPAFPKTLRVVLLSFSSILRALCGVAAGSSKASLSAHFAKWGNLGELNAKDSSQETVISLLGMLTGSLVVSHVSSPLATWTCLILLLSIHLAMNHAAVRSVSLHTLNRQRANLVFSAYLADGTVMSPKKVSSRERIFERDGVLRWKGQGSIGSARVGVSLQDLLKAWAGAQSVTGSFRDPDAILSRIVEIFSDERYLLWYQHPNREVCIALKDEATAQDQMKAWAHALWLAHRLESASLATGATPDKVLGVIEQVRTDLSTRWVACMQDIKSAKWDLNNTNLETTSGLRLHVGESGTRDAWDGWDSSTVS